MTTRKASTRKAASKRPTRTADKPAPPKMTAGVNDGIPPLDPARIPARLKWLARLRYSLADTKHEKHPTHHAFVQELHGARWLAATDGSTLVLARLADDELEGVRAENLLSDVKYPVNADRLAENRANMRRFIKWLTPTRPTAVVNLDRLREWATGTTEVVGVECPLCRGTGHNPFVGAGEAASRLNLYFDEGDFEYFNDIKTGRLFGVLFDRTRLGDVLKYVESDATRSCGVVVRSAVGGVKDAETEPALIFTDSVRLLLMPMRDPEPSSARANGDYFPTATYVVSSRHGESKGDAADIGRDQSATTSVVNLSLKTDDPANVPAVAAPPRLVVRCEPPDEPRISTEFGGPTVVAAMSASGGWFIPACLSASVTSIIGGK